MLLEERLKPRHMTRESCVDNDLLVIKLLSQEVNEGLFFGRETLDLLLLKGLMFALGE